MGVSDTVRRSTDQEAAWEAFLGTYPGYEATRALDELRAREFARLDETRQVYLDYTGSGLYAASQVRRHAEMLCGRVLGNPHSANPTSLESTRHLESCRRRVLEFFRAPESDYVVAFTANASHALKLVGESFPFGEGDDFLLTFDNHNSVNGIREFARRRGARTRYVPMIPPGLRVDETLLDSGLGSSSGGGKHLFAYPAQSNFSGVQHPLSWTARAKERAWSVLLDVAAFVPTNRLDISAVRPDFAVLSFYKMFGYPTGVGALVARREALEALRRPWFAGGTINVASVQADQFVLAAGAAAFEDGTPDFAAIPAVTLGLDLIDEVGIETVHARVKLLASWLLDAMLSLRHGNGVPLVRLYGPDSMEARGATLTFNLQDATGSVIDHEVVEARASERRISLRTGCFCNPGAGELAMGLTRGDLERCFVDGTRMSYDDLRRCIDPHAAGAVRVSLGLATNFPDVWAFLQHLREYL